MMPAFEKRLGPNDYSSLSFGVLEHLANRGYPIPSGGDAAPADVDDAVRAMTYARWISPSGMITKEGELIRRGHCRIHLEGLPPDLPGDMRLSEKEVSSLCHSLFKHDTVVASWRRWPGVACDGEGHVRDYAADLPGRFQFGVHADLVRVIDTGSEDVLTIRVLPGSCRGGSVGHLWRDALRVVMIVEAGTMGSLADVRRAGACELQADFNYYRP
jgi:hypothetical protein